MIEKMNPEIKVFLPSPEKTFDPDQRMNPPMDIKYNDTSEQSDESESISCRNEDLEGAVHPVTGIPFERKTIVIDGVEKEGVFPVFDSLKDVQLPPELYKAIDREQFDYCNQKLKKAIQNDPELRAKFTDEQIEQIMNGDTPDGFVWHHNEEEGKMQLVEQEKHQKTGHTGGKSIWGGGSENR